MADQLVVHLVYDIYDLAMGIRPPASVRALEPAFYCSVLCGELMPLHGERGIAKGLSGSDFERAD